MDIIAAQKPKRIRKTARIEIRVTPEQKDFLEQLAKQESTTISDLLLTHTLQDLNQKWDSHQYWKAYFEGKRETSKHSALIERAQQHAFKNTLPADEARKLFSETMGNMAQK